MFGPIRGEWGDSDWKGWWGDDPPYHAPTYVLTHHARDPIEMEGGTTFHFVTEGIESAYEQAKAVAGGQNISIAGGASCAQQALKAGLVDEVDLQMPPVILGAGSGSSTASSRESRSSSWCACSRLPARSTSATGWSSSTLVPLRKRRARQSLGREAAIPFHRKQEPSWPYLLLAKRNRSSFIVRSSASCRADG